MPVVPGWKTFHMARLSLHRWLKHATHTRRPVRRYTEFVRGRRYRPHVEGLEDRCVPSTVTNLNDAGAGSLRDALATTPAGGTVDFQPGLAGTITLTSGELAISQDLTLTGPGAGMITVSGNHASRVFDIAASATVAISGLTISAGERVNESGGGIANAGTLNLTAITLSGNVVSPPSSSRGVASVGGGGIYNTGTLTLTASTLSNNHATGGDYESDPMHRTTTVGEGGGIYNAGTLTVANTTFSGNAAGHGGSGGALYNTGMLTLTASTLSGNSAVVYITPHFVVLGGHGGGIYNTGTLTLTASTLSGNSATDFAGTASGGGIYNTGAGTLTLTGCTLSGNSALRVGGGIDGNATLQNTLVAGNTALSSPDVVGSLTSQGHNLIGDGTGASGFVASDLVGTGQSPIDPRLGRLADFGGPTQTVALLAGSPAIGAGDPTGAPQWDQRGPGFARVIHGRMDIGALEVQSVATVTTTADAGPGSLRQAILDNNAAPGPNVIAFAIAAGGVQTIRPTSSLPTITQPVAIDGTTQPGYAGTPLIVLTGGAAGRAATGLTIDAGNSFVRGLVINDFFNGIALSGNGGDLLVGNYLGTDSTGTQAAGNRQFGLLIRSSAPDNTVGGSSPGAGNLIAGNQGPGLVIRSGFNQVLGNTIGTDVSGTLPLGNAYGVDVTNSNNTIAGNLISANRYDGVYLEDTSRRNLVVGNQIGTDRTGTLPLGNKYGVLISGAHNTIGGTSPGAGNLISGNAAEGVALFGDHNRVQGNYIGTDVSGTQPLGNGANGIFAQDFGNAYDNTIGGYAAGAGNTIAFNGNDGVLVDAITGTAILRNAIFANGNLGIELAEGGNNDQAAPVLTAATADAQRITISGSLTSTPDTTFTLQFFSNSADDPGEGQSFLGSVKVTTDASGTASFTITRSVPVAPGQFVTATATDPGNNTSPFSDPVQVSAAGAVSPGRPGAWLGWLGLAGGVAPALPGAAAADPLTNPPATHPPGAPASPGQPQVGTVLPATPESAAVGTSAPAVATPDALAAWVLDRGWAVGGWGSGASWLASDVAHTGW